MLVKVKVAAHIKKVSDFAANSIYAKIPDYD